MRGIKGKLKERPKVWEARVKPFLKELPKKAPVYAQKIQKQTPKYLRKIQKEARKLQRGTKSGFDVDFGNFDFNLNISEPNLPDLFGSSKKGKKD